MRRGNIFLEEVNETQLFLEFSLPISYNITDIATPRKYPIMDACKKQVRQVTQNER